MQIYLRNEINLGDQMEVVEQVFPVEVTEKNNQQYLIFKNEEEEKVVIKVDEQELVMTRFSNPKSIMRFFAEKEAIVTIPTPLGMQHFVTDTKHYQVDRSAGAVVLLYDLKQLEADEIFASYQMEIHWE